MSLHGMRGFVLAVATLALSACAVGPAPVQGLGPVAQQGRTAPRLGCDTRFSLVNQAGIPIREFYFSPASSGGFGPNRIGRQMVGPGQSLDFAAGQPGRYDFRVVMADGYRTHRMGADVCAMSRMVMNQRTLVAQ